MHINLNNGNDDTISNNNGNNGNNADGFPGVGSGSGSGSGRGGKIGSGLNIKKKFKIIERLSKAAMRKIVPMNVSHDKKIESL